jgi:hypothetical protein
MGWEKALYICRKKRKYLTASNGENKRHNLERAARSRHQEIYKKYS